MNFYSVNVSNTSSKLTSSRSPLSATVPLSALAQVTNVLQVIYFLIDAYLIPLFLIFVIVNNLLCLLVFLCDREFKRSHSTNARYYYTFLAVIDMIAIYDWEFPVIYLTNTTIQITICFQLYYFFHKFSSSLVTDSITQVEAQFTGVRMRQRYVMHAISHTIL